MSSQGYQGYLTLPPWRKIGFRKSRFETIVLRFRCASLEIKIPFPLFASNSIRSSLIGLREISFEFETSRSRRNNLLASNNSFFKFAIISEIAAVDNIVWDYYFFFFFLSMSRVCRQRIVGEGKEKGGKGRAKRYEEGNNKFFTHSSIFSRGDTKSRLSPAEPGRAALKGFLNKPITIRGGVIINEAPAGKAR